MSHKAFYIHQYSCVRWFSVFSSFTYFQSPKSCQIYNKQKYAPVNNIGHLDMQYSGSLHLC